MINNYWLADAEMEQIAKEIEADWQRWLAIVGDDKLPDNSQSQE